VIELTSPLTFLLLINSILIILLILNQNDNIKDSITNQNSNSSNNPLENITWISFLFQLSLLLIKIKTNDF
jgi:uncharacterized protein with PQ loop repeat